MKIGILRETKTPPDRRVALTPENCLELMEKYNNLEIKVQPENSRSYTNEEYRKAGIEIADDLSDCDILLGVKEVKIDTLLANKTYLFFSHTAKKQSHNKDLLLAILKNNIRLVDYEYLTTEENTRVVAFGRWAGIIGAYNALIACGKRFGTFDLKPAWQCRDKSELSAELKKVRTARTKILITGGGRVAHGAMETLKEAGIKKIDPGEYLENDFQETVFTQLDPWHYTRRKDGQEFDLNHFFQFPQEYESGFQPYTRQTDVLIACHYWDPKSPVFFEPAESARDDFRIRIIADVSCDIPGPIPSTLRASSIAFPFYGYDPVTRKESDPWLSESITVMAVDNLPGELPRDASADFGRKLIDEVIPHLVGKKQDTIIERATIAKEGRLTEKFRYLQDFVYGRIS